MAEKLPIRTVFDGDGNATGLAEFQSGEFIGVAYGGTGANTFSAGILTADGTNAFSTVTAPSGTIVGTTDTQTLTNKTINSASNTITITESDISDLGSYITASTSDTLTNKTLTTPVIAEIDNATTITLDAGTNINLDADGGNVYLKDGGTQYGNLKNNSGELQITSGSGDTAAITMSGANVTVVGNLTVSGTTTTVDSTTVNIQNAFVFEGSTADEFETTLTVTDPTADRTITLPDASGGIPVFATAPTSAVTDGTANQVLKTDGSGNLSFGSVSTDLAESTFSPAPASEGNFDLAKAPDQTGSVETPFEATGNDAFGVPLTSTKFSLNDPVGSTNSVDLGAFA